MTNENAATNAVQKNNFNSWTFITSLLLFINGLRGFKELTYYNASQYMVNYRCGFVKRGLVGEILRHFNVFQHDPLWVISLVSYVLVIFNFVLLDRVIRRIITDGALWQRLIVLAFVSSVSVIYLAHITGFYHQFAILFTLILLLNNSFERRFWVAVILLPLLLLIYEVSFLLVFPVIFLSLLLPEWETLSKAKVWRVLLLFAGLTVLMIIMSGASLSKETIKLCHGVYLLQGRENAFVNSAFDALHFSFKDSIYNILFLRNMSFVGLFLASVAMVIFPTIFFILYGVKKELRWNVRPRLLKLLILGAIFAPLPLSLIAYDYSRWFCQSLMNAFFIFAIAVLSSQNKMLKKADVMTESNNEVPERNSELGLKVLPWAILLIAVNGFSDIPLQTRFDKINLYPFWSINTPTPLKLDPFNANLCKVLLITPERKTPEDEVKQGALAPNP